MVVRRMAKRFQIVDKELIRAEGKLLQAALDSADYLRELTAEGNMDEEQYGASDFALIAAAKAYRKIKKESDKLRRSNCET